MRERDTAWVLLEEKERPAVVLELSDELIRVAYGTRELNIWDRVEVQPDTRQGRAFPLSERTCFYGANTCWAQLTELRVGAKPCSLELFFAIRGVVETYDARVALE